MPTENFSEEGYGVESSAGEVGTNSTQESELDAGKVGQEQIHDLLFSEQLSWQAIIYDLINTEKLDPWDIDIVLLANKYIERVREMEEANLFVSSKVLFAAALLLRLKSEILLNRYLTTLDELLFGKEEKRDKQEKLEFDEEVPELIPKTPLPRARKVSLQELMEALGKAIKTENRRIERVIIARRREAEVEVVVPKREFNIRDKIKEVYSKLRGIFSRESCVGFSEFCAQHKFEKIDAFIPLLHLDYQHKLFLEQERHLGEIWIHSKTHYEQRLREEMQALAEQSDSIVRE
ncbi:hypothetical protein D6817_01685 [Candidatus Pacearchaeota archaeon]|nr:MAG: hypothetical protein D6817_01685 [Candidatus Pacearchaeota archaeon]